MTRIPVPAFRYEPGLVLGGAKFYPLVGALVALGAIGIERGLRSHLPQTLVALAVLAYLVIITGGFHEDGLADTADALGGGWTARTHAGDHARQPHRKLRNAGNLLVAAGSLGAAGSAMPAARFPFYMLTAHVLCRWTTLPLGAFVGSARKRWPGSETGAQDSADLGCYWIAAGVSDRGLGPAHAGPGAHRGGQLDNASQRFVLPLADWRHHGRLLRRDQPTGGNRGLCLRGVAMSPVEPMTAPVCCTIILVRHAPYGNGGRFCGHIDPPLSTQGLSPAIRFE